MKILVVDDDINICEVVRLNLNKAGYDVICEHNGNKAVEALSAEPDMVILDIMMPGKDGISLAKHIRMVSPDMPIMMLTARGETADKVAALSGGADDYMTKPFDSKELIARVRALLRRAKREGAVRTVLTFDKLVIDIVNYTLTVDGTVHDMPPKELELLYYLALGANTTYTRDQLLNEVWGYEYYGDSRTVDVHINRLRDKVDGVSDQWEIKTVRGVGYRFQVKAAKS